jgi:hypothetical protein
MLSLFDAVAASASVPFNKQMNGASLHHILATGVVPRHLEPHLERVLAELPIGMVAEMLFTYPSNEQEKIVNNLLRLAKRWDIRRIEKWLMTG